MKSEYRNSKRSRELIREALIALLAKKRLDEITVTDIVKAAGINRGTFYNHYRNTTDILEEIKNELLSRLYREIKKARSADDVGMLLSSLVAHFVANEKEYKILVKSLSRSMIDEVKSEFIAAVAPHNHTLSPLKFAFIVNGLTGIYLDYLQGKTARPLTEITEEATEIVRTIVEE